MPRPMPLPAPVMIATLPRRVMVFVTPILTFPHQGGRDFSEGLRPTPTPARLEGGRDFCPYCAITPPSMTNSEPVMYDASSDARKSAP